LDFAFEEFFAFNSEFLRAQYSSIIEAMKKFCDKEKFILGDQGDFRKIKRL
jgi:hypothetical protein